MPPGALHAGVDPGGESVTARCAVEAERRLVGGLDVGVEPGGEVHGRTDPAGNPGGTADERGIVGPGRVVGDRAGVLVERPSGDGAGVGGRDDVGQGVEGADEAAADGPAGKRGERLNGRDDPLDQLLRAPIGERGGEQADDPRDVRRRERGARTGGVSPGRGRTVDVHSGGRDVHGGRPVVRERGERAGRVRRGDDQLVGEVMSGRVERQGVIVRGVVAGRRDEDRAKRAGIRDGVGRGLIGVAGDGPAAPARVDHLRPALGGVADRLHGGGVRAVAGVVEELHRKDRRAPDHPGHADPVVRLGADDPGDERAVVEVIHRVIRIRHEVPANQVGGVAVVVLVHPVVPDRVLQEVAAINIAVVVKVVSGPGVDPRAGRVEDRLAVGIERVEVVKVENLVAVRVHQLGLDRGGNLSLVQRDVQVEVGVGVIHPGIGDGLDDVRAAGRHVPGPSGVDPVGIGGGKGVLLCISRIVGHGGDRNLIVGLGVLDARHGRVPRDGVGRRDPRAEVHGEQPAAKGPDARGERAVDRRGVRRRRSAQGELDEESAARCADAQKGACFQDFQAQQTRGTAAFHDAWHGEYGIWPMNRGSSRDELRTNPRRILR